MTKTMHLLTALILYVFLLLFFPAAAFAKIELTYSAPPAETDVDHPFTLDVTLSGADQTAEYYIRGVFYKQNTTQYFGLTQNNDGNWQTDTNLVTQFYKITGNGTNTITFKPDTHSSDLIPNTSYFFKVGRYTPGGSLTWSEQTPAVVFLSAAITPTPFVTVAVNPSPTPSTPPVVTPTAVPTSYINPSSIIISEVMACPNKDEGEWVELFNSSDSNQTIHNWKIKDSIDTHNIDVSSTISAHSYLVVHISSAILNNAGDSVRLFTDQNVLNSQMSYIDCQDGTSFILVDGSWQATQTVTPGSTNIFTPVDTPAPTTDASPSPTLFISETVSEIPILENTVDIDLNDLFDESLIASDSTEMSSESAAILPQESTPETKIKITSQQTEKPHNSVFSASTAFLLGGGSYVLSAALLAQRWYNLSLYAVTAISSST
ncbi:MAG: lamin tail domain-containing protein [Patescibacteria group bacterium]